MTTEFEVRSLLCGNTTRITVERRGNDASTITVESTCEKIREYSEKIREIGIRDACKSFSENPVYVSASSSKIPADCLVPCGVVMALWGEFGMISKNLLRGDDAQSIRFIR